MHISVGKSIYNCVYECMYVHTYGMYVAYVQCMCKGSMYVCLYGMYILYVLRKYDSWTTYGHTVTLLPFIS